MALSITYYVHSITTDNELGFATGWQPGKLSAEGIRRAKAVGEKLAGIHYDAIISSDLERAAASTRLFFGDKYQGLIDSRLREADYGDFTGQPAKLFKNDMEKYIAIPFPNGESYRDVQARMEDFLHDSLQSYEGKHIAIVGHQATQLALEVINGKTWQQAIAEDWRRRQAWQLGWEYHSIAK